MLLLKSVSWSHWHQCWSALNTESPLLSSRALYEKILRCKRLWGGRDTDDLDRDAAVRDAARQHTLRALDRDVDVAHRGTAHRPSVRPDAAAWLDSADEPESAGTLS